MGSQANQKDHLTFLQRAIEISRMARESGNTPFGALLVDKDGRILMEQGNVEITEHRCTGHAETALMERASHTYSPDFLWNCTLYTTAEPCAMCAGAMYWGNLGRVVYGISEKELLALTGDDPQNPTFDLPCREIFARGQKRIEVIGPFPELADEIAAVHEGFWNSSESKA
ncbi:tRNA-specific adenosine deaminase [Paenibacillus sp. J45TS6]|uniref:nucleoside deaminase n=1 Tax=Paenibacillus sp. J45TS6 TaxID=2807196 RepID=UPI001AFDDA8E|nr:nucleoside deaminase [Paenibacillus sp. J45TS6]GIP42679.1 tRNA-specific adenosine deaminase [Paenibacillus sp. J45TS6]